MTQTRIWQPQTTRQITVGLHLFWAALAAVAILGVILAANTHPGLWVWLSYYAAI